MSVRRRGEAGSGTAGDYTASIDWGDYGPSELQLPGGTTSFTVRHAYSAYWGGAGRPIVIRVADEDGYQSEVTLGAGSGTAPADDAKLASIPESSSLIGVASPLSFWPNLLARSIKSAIVTAPSPFTSPICQVAPLGVLKWDARSMKSAMLTVPSMFRSPISA